MPGQLPLQSAGVDLLAQFHHLTLADAVTANSYQAQVDVAVASQASNAPTTNDAAREDVYKTDIIAAHSAIEDLPPTWFISAMTKVLASLQITSSLIRNHQLSDGSLTPFKIVPFNDGSMPTHAPHELPPLVNVTAIRALNVAQITAYAAGYGLENAGTPAEMRVKIGKAVGCTVYI